MKAKTMAMVAGAAALVWWLSKGGGLKGLLGLGEDIFGEDLTAAGVPYDPVSQSIGVQPSYPYSPYNPYSTVSPQYPTYPTPYSPYTGGYPYGATPPYTGSPSYIPGYPYGTPTYLPQSTYATPSTVYPSIGGSSLLTELEQLYGGGSEYSSPYSSLFGSSAYGSMPSLFGSSAASTETAANQLKDSYISYGLQSGILQVTFCPQIPIPGGSQYHGCTFSWTTSTGKMKTGNYASAASAMKRYETTGRLN